jgi:Flp pilus assembly protein TadD
MYESWVDFTVRNAAGKRIYESGSIQPKDLELDPTAHSFTNRLVNKQGGQNALHQVWDNRVVAYNNTIQSGRSQLVRYSFTMPRSGGPVTVTARVRYRRFDQHFMDFGMSMVQGTHYNQPTVDMVSTTRTLVAGTNAPVAAPKPDSPEAKALNPEWMRWNNYGIALLDAQQYAAAVAAFQRVATMRPDYADAPTNIAITYIAWEKYDDALPYLQQSLTLAKDNARALYYLALVQRNEGQVDEAIANLQKVAAAFPRSRDAHRELGFSFYQLHKYELARAEYEAVQSIDPDDLAAHYNLSILYRRLGLKDKAAVEAAYFASTTRSRRSPSPGTSTTSISTVPTRRNRCSLHQPHWCRSIPTARTAAADGKLYSCAASLSSRSRSLSPLLWPQRSQRALRWPPPPRPTCAVLNSSTPIAAPNATAPTASTETAPPTCNRSATA